jgi:DNA/RNA endonuclease YhcR with UshA esterase domain
MKKAVIAMAILAAIGGGYGFYEYNRGHESMATAAAAQSMAASAVFQEFAADETAANTKFLGKVIEIKGKVSSSSTEDSTTTIVLFAGSETGTISCKLDPLAQHKRTTFTEGEEVTVKGICTGSLSMMDELEVIMERCVVN